MLARPDGGTSPSAMAGLDRSSFNTEPGMNSKLKLTAGVEAKYAKGRWQIVLL